jgi:hypothetical protein
MEVAGGGAVFVYLIDNNKLRWCVAVGLVV